MLEELDNKKKGKQVVNKEFEETYVKIDPKEVIDIEGYNDFFDYEAFTKFEIFPIKGIDKKKKIKKKKKKAEANSNNNTELPLDTNKEIEQSLNYTKPNIEEIKEALNKDIQENVLKNTEAIIDKQEEDDMEEKELEESLEEDNKLNDIPEVKVPDCKVSSNKPKPSHKKAEKKIDRQRKKELMEEKSKYKEELEHYKKERERAFNYYKPYTSTPKKKKTKKKKKQEPKVIPEDIITKLNKDITNTVTRLNIHNTNMFKASQHIVKIIESVASKVFERKIQGQLYGSVATGLSLEDSDIDIALENIISQSNDKYISNLITLGDYFQKEEFVKECTTTLTARAPVIKLVVEVKKLGIKFMKEEVKVDITIDDRVNRPPVFYGIKFTSWVMQKLQIIDCFRSLVILVKRLIYNHQLNLLFYGTL